MLIKKKDTIEIKNSENCAVIEYPLHNKNMGFAVAKINGRYPAKGKSFNAKSDLLYYITSGKGTIHTIEGSFNLEAGDAFLIYKEQWYWIETKNIEIIMPSSPEWLPEQYKQID